MLDSIDLQWLALAVVAILALLIAWWIFARGQPERRRAETPDVLDPGAAPAERNSLLVEAPPAAALTAAPIAGVAPDIMGGLGEVIAAATAQEIGEAARPLADERAAPAPAASEGDDLGRIKGVGPKLVARLGELGVTRYDQIAGWSDDDIARIDAQLGPFAGRIARDNWIEQCRHLATGDIAGYEARFGKL